MRASKQPVRTLLHNLSLCTLVQSLQIEASSILYITFLLVRVLCQSSPSPLPFQPSPGVGNNRNSDATLNLLRRLARSRLDFPPPQHEAQASQARNHLGYFL